MLNLLPMLEKFRNWVYVTFFSLHFNKVIAKARKNAEEYGKAMGFIEGLTQGREEILKGINDENMEKLLIDINSVISEVDGKCYLGNNLITEQDKENLIAEAKTINSFTYWKLVQETIKQRAIEKSMLLSTEWEHVLAGKMMLDNLNIQRKILKLILSLKVHKK
jgi:hypothetical protein